MINLTIPALLPLQISTFMETLMLLLLLLIVVIFTFTRDLLFSIALMIFFSLATCLIYMLMYAPDVALTEAAVGACITTIIPIAAIIAVRPSDTLSKLEFSSSGLLACVMLIISTIFVTKFMPFYGNVTNITNKYLVPHYIENSGSEIGINSTVASILASYRGFDTLGEIAVILTAGLCVFMLLFNDKFLIQKQYSQDKLLLVIAKIIMPVITIYALYLQIHGEISPGGGFQAGSILASLLIFYAVITNSSNLLSIFTFSWLRTASVIGVLIYTITGIAAIYFKGEFLNYSVLGINSMSGQKFGIFVIELGVAITVFSAITMIYLLFAMRGNHDH